MPGGSIAFSSIIRGNKLIVSFSQMVDDLSAFTGTLRFNRSFRMLLRIDSYQ